MPKERYGNIEYAILEYLYKSKQIHNNITDINQWLGKNISYHTIDTMINKDLITEKRILDFRAIRMTIKGKRVYESRYIKIKSPIKQIDITSNYYNNRFKNPKQYKLIRIAIGRNTTSKRFLTKIGYKSNQISKNSQVKMGLKEVGKWEVQSVRITINETPKRNQELAIKIYNEIENWLTK